MNTNRLTYNVFADGELIYLGYDKDTATLIAECAQFKGKRVRLTAIGDGYSYDL